MPRHPEDEYLGMEMEYWIEEEGGFTPNHLKIGNGPIGTLGECIMNAGKHFEGEFHRIA